MNIKVYGTGCAKCQELFATVESVLKGSGVEAALEKVTDIDRIVQRGVMLTPALEIDGEIVSSGRVPSEKEIAELITSGATHCGCGCACAKPTRKRSPRRIIGTALLVFSAGVLAWSFAKDAGKCKCCGGGAAICDAPTTVERGVTTVYYFHGARRCMTCNKIEKLTRETVEGAFREDLANGTMKIVAVNLDEPQNEHFVQDFKLTTRSVVVQRGGQYENLDKVWQLVHGDEAAFRSYITDGIVRVKGAKP